MKRVVPVYDDPHDSSFLLDQIWETGFVHVHVHPLSTDKGIVTFDLDDPELFPGVRRSRLRLRR